MLAAMRARFSTSAASARFMVKSGFKGARLVHSGSAPRFQLSACACEVPCPVLTPRSVVPGPPHRGLHGPQRQFRAVEPVVPESMCYASIDT
eukprot:342769-Rhodomonas_salina.1